MGIFSRKKLSPQDPQVAIDANGPLCFRIEDMFSISGKGLMFTGSVESGTFVIGAPVTLQLPDRLLLAQVAHIESKRGKRESAYPGDAVAIRLDGVKPDDLPQTFRGSIVVIDIEAVKGSAIRGRQESDGVV